MTDDTEERFRAACSAYLAAAEQLDLRRALAQMAADHLRNAERDADQARDQLLQVVRERNAAAQLGEYGPAGGPVGDGLDEQRRAHYGHTEPVEVLRTITWPDQTDYWAQHSGMCPECGISWRHTNPDCPHRVVDWHPKGK